MSDWKEAHLAESVACVLELIAPGRVSRREPDADVVVVSYREDFDRLWAFDDRFLAWLTTGHHLVVVWDGTPSTPTLDAFNAGDYVTAVDWCVAFAVAADRRRASRWRISLVDFVRDPRPVMVRTFQCLQRAIPPTVPNIAYVRPTELADVFRSISSDAVESSPFAGEILRELWESHLAQPHEKHSIANVVGPLHLSRTSDSDSIEDRVRRAIASLVSVLEPTSANTLPDAPNPLRERFVDRDLFSRFRDGVRFVLVDDLAHVGYHDVLARWLLPGFETVVHADGALTTTDGRHSLLSVTCADHARLKLLDGLDTLNADEPGFVDSIDILLLDLRLFGNGRDEIAFMQRLVEIYHRTNAPALDDVPLARAAAAAESFVRGDPGNHLERLTLLPLLVARLDPSLPIVIFSTTQQRRIAAAFEDTPTIITTFTKPASRTEAADAIDSLREAITRALRLHEVRIVWQRLVELAREVSKTGTKRFASRNLRCRTGPIKLEITRREIHVIAGEIRGALLAGRFADALLGPDNWIDAHIGDYEVADKELLKTTWGLALLATARAAHSTWRDAIAEVRKTSATKPYLANAQVELADPAQRAVIERNTPDALCALGLVGLVSKDDVVGLYFDARGVVPREPRDIFDPEAELAAFNVLRGLRHRRAHYRVQPAHDEGVRDHAVACWLWFIENLLCDFAIVTSGPASAIETAVAHCSHEGHFVSASFRSDGSATGEASCRRLWGKLEQSLQAGWLQIERTDLRSIVAALADVTTPAPPAVVLPVMESPKTCDAVEGKLLHVRWSTTKDVPDAAKLRQALRTIDKRITDAVRHCKKHDCFTITCVSPQAADELGGMIAASHLLFVLGGRLVVTDAGHLEASRSRR